MDASLFGHAVPAGFTYQAELITPADERDLISAIQQITFTDVVMRGAVARRRTAHFGVAYGYDARRTEPGVSMPGFLTAAAGATPPGGPDSRDVPIITAEMQRHGSWTLQQRQMHV